jgi:hypothetical protein
MIAEGLAVTREALLALRHEREKLGADSSCW